MAKAMSKSAFPKCIRERDFSLIKSFHSFLQYQHDSLIDASLPALAEEEFNLLQSFPSLKDFTDYFYDVYVRDWTSNTASESSTWEQFQEDWDSAAAELLKTSSVHYSAEEADEEDAEESSCYMLAFDQLCIKERGIRENRLQNGLLIQEKAFRTEKILKARKHKEDREFDQKVKSTKKYLSMSGKATTEKEALEMAKNMVCIKPNAGFARARFSLVSYEGAEEIEVCPYKKRAAKTFHEKHKAMKKYATYHERLQEIRDMILENPSLSRKEAKRAYNIKHHAPHAPTAKPQESTMDYVIHPAYHNAIARVVTGKNSFSFMLDIPKETHESLLMSKYPINARLLSILCTLNH